MEKEYSVLKHELVPKHTILNDEEKKKLLERFNIKPNHLPRILTTDPVVKELGAKEGNVLKIDRKSPVSGTITYYRIVSRRKK